MDVTARNGVTAIVEYDYTAKEPDELDLVKGATIHNIKQLSGGWWEGTLQTNGKTGMFPDNFVRVIDATATTTLSGTTDDNTNVTLRDKAATKHRRCKVIYSYTQVNDDELSLAVGDVIEFLGEVEEGWWRGRLKTKIGVFPSNFVVDIQPSPVFASKRPAPTGAPATASTALSATTTTTTTAASSSKLSATNSSTTTTTASPASTTTTTNSAVSTASALANAALAAVTTKKSNRLSFHSSKEDLLNSSTTATSTTSTTSNMATSSTSSSSSTVPTATAALSTNDDGAPILPPKPQRDYCRVEFPYAPQNDDELELKVGDIITIINMELPDKGWWKGEMRGKVGVFPDNFVKLLAPPDVIPTVNDTQQQTTHSQKTAKIINSTGMSSTNTTAQNLATSSTTITQSQSSSTATTAASTSKVFIKKSGSTSSTQSSNRKDSFGSYDSLNDILSETGLQTGNVAAQRKSLENKNLDLTNAPDAGMRMKRTQQQQQQQQQQQESSSTVSTTKAVTTSNSNSMQGTSSELRKSIENMDDKSPKTKPPPVLATKPSVPSKKSATVTSVAANLFTSLKTKVKSVENTLTTSASQDAADGIGSSKMSPQSAGGLPESAPSGNVVMRRAATIAVEDTDFDRVERASILPDMRAGRVKAPKRRPPSAAINVIGESNNNNSVYLNGSTEHRASIELNDDSIKPTQHSSDDNSTTGEEQLAKPKPREWEKKKAPWMEELKASQVKKKTSPIVEPRSDTKVTNTAAMSSSSVAATTKVQSSSVTSTSSTMQQSMIVESSSQEVTKKEHISRTTTKTSDGGNHLESLSKSFNHKVTADGVNSVDDIRAPRPNSLSIRNRSVSPSQAHTGSSGGSARNILKSATSSSASPGESAHNNTAATTNSNNTTTTAHSSTAAKTHSHVNNHHAQQPQQQHHHHPRTTSTAATAGHTNHHNGGDGGRILELERRIEKLESVVHTQQRTIDELVRTLREETDRVQVLRGELDKYAQCVTQV